MLALLSPVSVRSAFSMTRLQSLTVFLNFSVSIRAYGAQETFILESYKRIDSYTLAARTFWNLARWVAIRTETLSGLFAAGLAVYLVYFDKEDAASTGFSLTMAVGFSSMILHLVRIFNQVQINGNR